MCANVCKSVLKDYPEDINFLCLISRANIALRLFNEAQKYLNQATKLSPQSSMARETYGDLLLARNKPHEAIREYQFALEINPEREQIKKKINYAKKVELDLKKNDTKKNNNASTQIDFTDEINAVTTHMEEGRLDNAEDILRDILKKHPNHVEAARLLAGVAMEHDRYRDAEIFLLRAVKNAPDYSRAWADLIKSQREQNKYDKALESADKLLSLDPNIADSHMLKASVQGMAGYHEAAIDSYKKALEISPSKAGAMCIMAHHLKTVGKQDEAIQAYRQAIQTKTDHTEAYWSLANLKTFNFTDEEVTEMERLLIDADLRDLGKTQLYNALGLEYESRKNYTKAFENMSACNTVRRKLESYDPVEFETTTDKVIDFFSSDTIKKNISEEKSVTPIFVVGLPRSGSTLIEQILASHSLVEGTHELGELTMAMRAVRDKAKIKNGFPKALTEFKKEHWNLLGQEYLQLTEKYRTDKLYFIDKNPNNFSFIGQIKLAIPNARIINAKRHPLDSCYGSFKQLFASGQPFSYDLVELGEYYMEYQRIMDHWHKVLPGFILDVSYEEVVAGLDEQVTRILEFCGLPFEESCLRFYETERAVKTASSEQVRKPIYSSSVNLWRNYEDKLADLIEILEPLLIKLPKKDRPKSL
ncbi:MAG: sulfotransferase [Pseudomonadota bacterium]|nr:sulfotransferase [Pseudomonadota bacterium]